MVIHTSHLSQISNVLIWVKSSFLDKNLFKANSKDVRTTLVYVFVEFEQVFAYRVYTVLPIYQLNVLFSLLSFSDFYQRWVFKEINFKKWMHTPVVFWQDYLCTIWLKCYSNRIIKAHEQVPSKNPRNWIRWKYTFGIHLSFFTNVSRILTCCTWNWCRCAKWRLLLFTVETEHKHKIVFWITRNFMCCT